MKLRDKQRRDSYLVDMTHGNIYHDLARDKLEMVEAGNLAGPVAVLKFGLRNYAVTLVEVAFTKKGKARPHSSLGWRALAISSTWRAISSSASGGTKTTFPSRFSAWPVASMCSLKVL